MDSNTEQNESKEQNMINEKVKNKLKEYSKLRCLYNLSNSALMYKRNISLICQERTEKSLNLNPNNNNYYSGSNSSVDVFDLKTIIQNLFGDYIEKHNIDIEKEVIKAEEERDERIRKGKEKKPYGSEMQKKLMAKKKQIENIQKAGEQQNSRKNHNVYVIKDSRYSKVKVNQNINLVQLSYFAIYI